MCWILEYNISITKWYAEHFAHFNPTMLWANNIPYGEYPSWLHKTLASWPSQKSSHTVVHIDPMHISTRPANALLVPINLLSPSEQKSTQIHTVDKMYQIVKKTSFEEWVRVGDIHSKKPLVSKRFNIQQHCSTPKAAMWQILGNQSRVLQFPNNVETLLKAVS